MSSNTSTPRSAQLAPDHEALLRLAIEESRKARETGQHPFAAILVGPEGKVLMVQHNAYMPDHDMTGHAERVLMTRASTTLPMQIYAMIRFGVTPEINALATLVMAVSVAALVVAQRLNRGVPGA